MNHSKECIEYQARIKQEIAEYERKWPNHCKTCGGSGALTSYQSVPYGSTSASFEVSDPCGCVEDGFCPRCGNHFSENEAFFSGDAPCPFCEQDLAKPDYAPYDDGWCGCDYLPENQVECHSCGSKMSVDEVFWATPEGVLNSDIGLPYCVRCFPLPPPEVGDE